MTDISASGSGRNWWNIGLWLAQVLLALAYGMVANAKMFQPIDQLSAMINWVSDMPVWFVRFIGVAEALGAVGLILPSLTRILPGLTVLAALGLSVLQVCAMVFHISRGEYFALPANLVLLGIAVFILWGRWKKAPILPR